jgi:hypothetical protein
MILRFTLLCSIMFSGCTVKNSNFTVKKPITTTYFFEYTHLHIDDICIEADSLTLIEYDTLLLDSFKLKKPRR